MPEAIHIHSLIFLITGANKFSFMFKLVWTAVPLIWNSKHPDQYSYSGLRVSSMPVEKEKERSNPHQLSKNKFCSSITEESLTGIALPPVPFL